MRSATLKRIILLITIIISALVLLQVYWLYKQYTFEQKEFSSNVEKSIRGLYEDIESYSSVHQHKSIETNSPNLFLIRMDQLPPREFIVDSLTSELEQVNIFSDCKIGAFDVSKGQYLFQLYIPTTLTPHAEEDRSGISIMPKEYSYLYLYFPHRNQYILSEMTWWIVLSILLLIALTSLAGSLFYLYKQRFLNETQSDFIKNVTHEFQTPLTTLTLGLNALSKSSIHDDPEKFSKYISLMMGQVQYLNRHIENLVKVIKTEAFGLGLNKTMVAPNELIQEVIEQLSQMINEKNGRVTTHLEINNVLINADRTNLYTSLLNVISNAIKYSPQPHIVISTESSGQHYTISIKDNGVGISQGLIKKIFKKFYRVPSGDMHNEKGLGLGLYFVKKIIDQHNGQIKINSIPGIGTEFIIILPIN